MSLLKITGTVLRRVFLPYSARRSYSESQVQSSSDDEFECKYKNILNKMDIDDFELRKALNDLHGMDLIPSPPIIDAGLRACRRLNDYALAIRFLEAVRFKCHHNKNIWKYVVAEIKPTLEELGIETPEELGYDKPELALACVYEPL